MRGQIDLNEVESRTKIRARYLRAMEDEEWDVLPGPVYVKSFLRTYADYLGLDSRVLIDEFKARYERPTDNELRPMSPLPRDRERSRRPPRVPSWAAVGLVLVAVVAALYVLGTRDQKSGTTPTSAHANRHLQRPAHRRTVTAFVKPTTVKLELVPTGQVYVCLVNGSGKKLIPGQIFGPGQTIPTETATKLLLTLGNASARMKVNGVPVNVASSATSIGFLLQPSGHSSLPPSRQPRCT